jgi:hypothetical protein
VENESKNRHKEKRRVNSKKKTVLGFFDLKATRLFSN